MQRMELLKLRVQRAKLGPVESFEEAVQRLVRAAPPPSLAHLERLARAVALRAPADRDPARVEARTANRGSDADG
jgi:hypothetical protein